MDDYMLFCILSGACISILSSGVILIQLLTIKYKDFANFLVFLLVSTDFIMSVSVFPLIYPLNSIMCIISSIFISLVRETHKLIIFYISYSMYSIIVKHQGISNKFFYLIFVFGILDMTYNLILILLMNDPKIESNTCYVTDASSSKIILLNIIFQLAPDLVILVSILWLYNCIRKTLKQEAICNDLKCASNRIFAKRLIGYGVVFILYFIPFYVVFLLNIFTINTESGSLRYLWLAFFAWYPFFDSIIYGCTKSFKRNLFNLCMRSPEFDMQEDVMFLLRNENVLRPRFYLDMIGESERIAL